VRHLANHSNLWLVKRESEGVDVSDESDDPHVFFWSEGEVPHVLVRFTNHLRAYDARGTRSTDINYMEDVLVRTADCD